MIARRGAHPPPRLHVGTHPVRPVGRQTLRSRWVSARNRGSRGRAEACPYHGLPEAIGGCAGRQGSAPSAGAKKCTEMRRLVPARARKRQEMHGAAVLFAVSGRFGLAAPSVFWHTGLILRGESRSAVVFLAHRHAFAGLRRGSRLRARAAADCRAGRQASPPTTIVGFRERPVWGTGDL